MTGTDKCPKCDYCSDTAFEECPKCGIIVKKFIEAQKRQEKQKKIEELEKETKRDKCGWFREKFSKKTAIIAGTFVLILLCGYGIKSYLLFAEETFFKRGNARFNKGEYSRAITEYSKAIEITPNYPEAYFKRGTSYYELKKHQKAIEDFDRAIRLDPKHVNAYFFRGATYYELKKYRQAMDDYNQAIHFNPDIQGIYNGRGIVYEKLGQNKLALEDYSRAINLDPYNASSLSNRGNVYKNLGHYHKAFDDHNRAISLNPNIPGVYHNRGAVYYEIKKYQQAIDDFNQAIRLDSNYTLSKKWLENAKIKDDFIQHIDNIRAHEWVLQTYDFVELANGVLKDRKTGLKWYFGPDIDVDWYKAEAWVESLNVGDSGWRMPKIRELKSLHYMIFMDAFKSSEYINPTAWSGEIEDYVAAKYIRFEYSSQFSRLNHVGLGVRSSALCRAIAVKY